jgi:proline iminopeptidase
MKSDNYLLENAGRIHHIPCRIVQGRYDVICPVHSAWELHQALPKSDLRVVPDGAHSPLEPGMVHELVTATEDFKSLW